MLFGYGLQHEHTAPPWPDCTIIHHETCQCASWVSFKRMFAVWIGYKRLFLCSQTGRMQNDGVLRTLRHIQQTEGLRGFFKCGMLPAVVVAAASSFADRPAQGNA